MQSEEIGKDNTSPADDRLNDLPVTDDQADEAKGGSISLNYTKVEFKNVGMGTVN